MTENSFRQVIFSWLGLGKSHQGLSPVNTVSAETIWTSIRLISLLQQHRCTHVPGLIERALSSLLNKGLFSSFFCLAGPIMAHNIVHFSFVLQCHQNCKNHDFWPIKALSSQKCDVIVNFWLQIRNQRCKIYRELIEICHRNKTVLILSTSVIRLEEPLIYKLNYVIFMNFAHNTAWNILKA